MQNSSDTFPTHPTSNVLCTALGGDIGSIKYLAPLGNLVLHDVEFDPVFFHRAYVSPTGLSYLCLLQYKYGGDAFISASSIYNKVLNYKCCQLF